MDSSPDVKFSAPVGRFDALRQGLCAPRSAISLTLYVGCAGVNDRSFDAFLWEYFMTKPYEERGEVRIVGTVSAPWPSFMVAARGQFVRQHAAQLRAMLRVIARAAQQFSSGGAESARRVSSSFGLQEADAQRWLAGTTYASEPQVVSRSALAETVAALNRARVLSSSTAVEDLVDESVAVLQ